MTSYQLIRNLIQVSCTWPDIKKLCPGITDEYVDCHTICRLYITSYIYSELKNTQKIDILISQAVQQNEHHALRARYRKKASRLCKLRVVVTSSSWPVCFYSPLCSRFLANMHNFYATGPNHFCRCSDVCIFNVASCVRKL